MLRESREQQRQIRHSDSPNGETLSCDGFGVRAESCSFFRAEFETQRGVDGQRQVVR